MNKSKKSALWLCKRSLLRRRGASRRRCSFYNYNKATFFVQRSSFVNEDWSSYTDSLVLQQEIFNDYDLVNSKGYLARKEYITLLTFLLWVGRKCRAKIIFGAVAGVLVLDFVPMLSIAVSCRVAVFCVIVSTNPYVVYLFSLLTSTSKGNTQKATSFLVQVDILFNNDNVKGLTLFFVQCSIFMLIVIIVPQFNSPIFSMIISSRLISSLGFSCFPNYSILAHKNLILLILLILLVIWYSSYIAPLIPFTPERIQIFCFLVEKPTRLIFLLEKLVGYNAMLSSQKSYFCSNLDILVVLTIDLYTAFAWIIIVTGLLKECMLAAKFLLSPSKELLIALKEFKELKEFDDSKELNNLREFRKVKEQSLLPK